MNSNHNNNQEINLSLIPQKLSSITNSISVAIYNTIRFILKNIWIFIALIIIGVGVGFYLDKQKSKIYKHEVIVVPNFGSTTYLYTTINNLEYDSKKSPITNVTISPIINVLEFVSSENNLKIAEYLSENNIQIDKHKKGNQTENIYKFHLITIYTNGKDENSTVVKNFLDELNKEKYFLEIQKIEKINRKNQLAEYEKSINDINMILEKMGNNELPSSRELNIEVHSDLNNLLDNKKHILNTVNWIKKNQVDEEKVIYDVSIFSNIKTTSNLFKIVVPVLILSLFLGLIFIRNIYKKHSPKA